MYNRGNEIPAHELILPGAARVRGGGLELFQLEEYRKVAAFKLLTESCKSQIAELESKAASRNKVYETALFELEQTRTKLRITQEERDKDSEALELYQEQVRKLELSSHRPIASV
jgi:protein HOOK3